jgi:ribulose-bisphosphate carboxylase large chain
MSSLLIDTSRFTATYRVRSIATEIEARATGIAVEQSVEMPVAPIEDPFVKDTIIGRVEGIQDRGDGHFDVRISLAVASCGTDAGQLFNMLFGNSSIQDDVTLLDVDLPPSLLKVFGGPRHGLDTLRTRVGAHSRALTASALKPQGLSPAGLGAIAGRLAEGGLDYIKDDHGLADQAYSPFAKRVPAVMAAVHAASARTGKATRYLPSLCGTLDVMRDQVVIARNEGVDTLLIAPMITGVSAFQALVAENRDMAFVTHPALAGASRIAPPVHFGKLFRLLGADGVVYPNYGGRFAYSPATCRQIATTSIQDWGGMKPAVPIPAGGMTAERVPEMLAFYGRDVMLLIGGGLLAAGKDLTNATAGFVSAVEKYQY